MTKHMGHRCLRPQSEATFHDGVVFQRDGCLREMVFYKEETFVTPLVVVTTRQRRPRARFDRKPRNLYFLKK